MSFLLYSISKHHAAGLVSTENLKLKSLSFCLLSTSESIPKLSHDSPLAPPYSHCVELLRKELVPSRDPNAPKFVYHLHTMCQELGQSIATPILQRTYSSHALARHHAKSWLFEEHRKLWADFLFSSQDEEYNQKSNRKCFLPFTPFHTSRRWGRQFFVWTTEQPLY